MILAINTAQRTHELALLDGRKLLAERRWLEARDDVDRLIPLLKELLEETKLRKTDLTDIAIVAGPGSFTSLRTGLSFANALAEGLKAKLWSITTFDGLRLKAGEKEALLAILHAGGQDIALDFGHIGPPSTLLEEQAAEHVIAEVPEALQKDLKKWAEEKNLNWILEEEWLTLGQVLENYGLEVFSSSSFVEARYLRPPHLTPGKGPWK